MKYLKKILLISMIIGSAFINASCWSYKDVERINVVMAFAIDKDKINDEYILTVEVARPESGQNEAKYMSDIYEYRGTTIFEAIRGTIEKAGKNLYWSHASIGILSKAVVSEDITPVIDFFYRDVEPRGRIMMLISKKETAKEILEIAHDENKLRTTQLEYIMENQEDISKYPKTMLIDISENFESKEKAILIPVVDIKQDDGRVMLEVSGSAILKYNKVVGYLTGDETQYALWVMGQLKGGLLVVRNIAGSSSNISFEIYKNKTKVKPSYNNNELRMKVHIITTVSIGEVSGNIAFYEEDVKKKIREDAEKNLKSKLEYVVKKVQSDYKSDIFSFGEKVNIKNKNLWKTLKPKWDEEFAKLPVDIDVDLIIKSSALSSKPIKED